MPANKRQSGAFGLPNTPAIELLSFRPFRGDEDYINMLGITEASKAQDDIEWSTSLEDIQRQYRHLVNCDPLKDAYFAEMNGEAIGFARIWWEWLLEGCYVCRHFASLVPAWRGKGIRRAMLRENERRLRLRLAEQPKDGPHVFEAWAELGERDWERLLKAEGYAPERYFFTMVRPNLEDIAELPLPEGIEVRSARPEDYRAIWEASVEAFQDHWGAEEPQETRYNSWLESSYFQPELWQVAWDGERVVGMVLNFVNEKENAERSRKRGYTEDISVRRPWRRRGVAGALIARSFQVLKLHGMEEAALGVDVDNPRGALALYESLGFQRDKRETCYRKPLAEGASR